MITAVAHGLSSGTQVFVTGVNGLSTGPGEPSLINDNVFWISRESDDTFTLYKNKELTIPMNGESANGYTLTQYNSGGTVFDLVVITADNHKLLPGTKIIITDVLGADELNQSEYYVDILDSNTVALYTDDILSVPLDGSAFVPYISGGVLSRVVTQFTQNTGVGVDAGSSLIEGEQNFFFGVNSAKNLTTGSYNMFFGHDVGNNMITGNSNISIGGDNLVDGLDNQVNIGSVFYFNGSGYTQFNSDVGMGIGTTATSVRYAAMTVYGGLGITDNTIIGGQVHFLSTETSISSSTGALIVEGGVGIVKDLYVDSTIIPSWGTGNKGIVFPSNPGIGTGDGARIQYYILADTLEDTVLELAVSDNRDDRIHLTASGSVIVTNNLESTSSDSGALQVRGGVGIGGNLNVNGEMIVDGLITGDITNAQNIDGGDTGSLLYQTGTSQTGKLSIGANGYTLASDGTNPYWADPATLTALSAGSAQTVFVNSTTIGVAYYLGLTEITGDNSPINSDTALSYVTSDVVTGDYFFPGNNVLNVPGSIYSIDGNQNLGGILYTPKYTVAALPHQNPRPGDVWVDTANSAFYQWIIDGDNAYWIQTAII